MESVDYDLTKSLDKNKSEEYDLILRNYVSHEVIKSYDGKIIIQIKYNGSELSQKFSAKVKCYLCEDFSAEKIQESPSKIFHGYYIKSFTLEGKSNTNLLELEGFTLNYCFIDCNVRFELLKFISNELSISNTIFTHDIRFSSINFENAKYKMWNCFLNGKEFNLFDVNFYCSGEVDFSYINSKNCTLYFNNSIFDSSEFIVKNHRLREDVDIFRLVFSRSTFRNNCKIDVENLDLLSIQSCYIEKSMNLNKCAQKFSILNTQILGQVDILHYVDIIEPINKYYKDEFKYEESSDSTIFINKTDNFLRLSKIYNNLGQYENEDRVYVEYMNNSLKYEKEVQKLKRFFNLNYLFKKLTGTVGDYGVNPSKALANSIFVIILFGLIYANIFCRSEFTNNIFESVSNGAYFSGITFLTIGYGDIHPDCFKGLFKSVIQLLTVIEGFVGVSLMSFFMVSVVRKVLR